MPRPRKEILETDSYYSRNRDYILAKAYAIKHNLPLPEKPVKEVQVKHTEETRKELAHKKELLYASEYNERYYQEKKEQILAQQKAYRQRKAEEKRVALEKLQEELNAKNPQEEEKKDQLTPAQKSAQTRKILKERYRAELKDTIARLSGVGL